MTNFDPAAEYRRLREVYEQMADEELAAPAEEADQLTDIARQTLAGEISLRRLGLPLNSSQSEPATQRLASGFGAGSGPPSDFGASGLDLTVAMRPGCDRKSHRAARFRCVMRLELRRRRFGRPVSFHPVVWVKFCNLDSASYLTRRGCGGGRGGL